MDKSYLIVILALGISLLFAGCTQTEPVTKFVCPDGKTTVTDVNACPAPGATVKALTPEEALEICYGMPSLQTASLNIAFEDSCIIGLAGKYKNTALCKKLSRDQRTPCFAIVAEAKNDPDTCLEAETQVDQCLYQYAADKKDGSICAKITDVDSKDRCYNDLANNLSDAALCDKIRNVDQKDSCYFSMAMRFRDSAYCNKITGSNQKEDCLQNIQSQSGQKSVPMYPK